MPSIVFSNTLRDMVDNFEQIKKHITFDDKDDFYFCQIIQRKKDGCNVPSANNGYRTIKTYYIRSFEDFDRRVDAIKQLCEQNNARCYFNINVRNAKEVALVASKAYIDLVMEDRCNQGHRVYDHACGITPKKGLKRRWIVDVDTKDSTKIAVVVYAINSCRSSRPREDQDKSHTEYDNVEFVVQTQNGVHLVTCGFDLGTFYDQLLYHNDRVGNVFSDDELKEICKVKKDNPTLMYFNPLKPQSDIENRETYF